MSGCMRRFNPDWFKTFGNWLEYSIVEDASYCLCCYLFKNETLGHGGGDAFSTQGFRTWKFDRFKIHIGGPSSVHNQNVKRCDDLMNQQQSIRSNIVKQEKKGKMEYMISLIASIDIARLLLTLGLPFRGHDESESSKRKGNLMTVLVRAALCYYLVWLVWILLIHSLNFDKDKILEMARLYPDDFDSEHKIEELGCQLENFVENIRDDSRFCNLKGLADLCKKLVEKKKHTSYHLVFLLLKLVLILPVATASVERAFSAMKYIKSDLRNRIADTYIIA
ncbi:uncharacterized protein LOC127756357 [Oryza glaberrima]|uniref:uncharacterized protein LOC127756357 n=1 Tax=Oryza glaberrima TaxID=4538 RepID=UPI00224C1FE1|nr:uncharacterized protein LOC127756357 [Oryza glaberrima]